MRGLSRPLCPLIRPCQCQSQSYPRRQHVVSHISPVQQSRPASKKPLMKSLSDIIKNAVDIKDVRAEMISRPPVIHSDIMSPLHSHRFTTALVDVLPKTLHKELQIPLEKVHTKSSDHSDGVGEHPQVPPGYHLVYFPLQKGASELCPDGTDPYPSPPDKTFTRRMWAGGSIQGFQNLDLNNEPAFCLERITDVQAKSSVGEEKLFVEVTREYASHKDFSALKDRKLTGPSTDGDRGQNPPDHDPKWITERRTLVFMRELSRKQRNMRLKNQPKRVALQTEPDYSVTLTPTPALLFHYSALSWNAHRIHLDKHYARRVEGYLDLLVHGPLSLTLMLSVLRFHLKSKFEFIDKIDYNHYAPLYVDMPMEVCVKLLKVYPPESPKVELKPSGAVNEIRVERRQWRLWIRGQQGVMCVKATAETVKRTAARKSKTTR